jgi:hypothetical protein
VKIFQRSLVALALAALAFPMGTSPVDAQSGIRVLIPSDDSCNAFIAALNSGDRGTMLNLGGWALGYLSGTAQQSGKNILGQTTSESLMDRIAESCQRDPNRAMSTVVMEIANSLLAQTK